MVLGERAWEHEAQQPVTEEEKGPAVSRGRGTAGQAPACRSSERQEGDHRRSLPAVAQALDVQPLGVEGRRQGRWRQGLTLEDGSRLAGPGADGNGREAVERWFQAAPLERRNGEEISSHGDSGRSGPITAGQAACHGLKLATS